MISAAQDALNEAVRNRVSEAELAAADAVLRAVFPDDQACQRVDERVPPPTAGWLGGDDVTSGLGQG